MASASGRQGDTPLNCSGSMLRSRARPSGRAAAQLQVTIRWKGRASGAREALRVLTKSYLLKRGSSCWKGCSMTVMKPKPGVWPLPLPMVATNAHVLTSGTVVKATA